MIAILTRYLGPTATLGSRMVATTANGHRLVMPFPGDEVAPMPGDPMANAHRVAAVELWKQQLAKLSPSDYRLVSGGTPDGWAHVFAYVGDEA